MTDKHQSGSLSAWKLRREEYRKRSGPVSNPGDGRMRRRERRAMKRAAVRDIHLAYPVAE